MKRTTMTDRWSVAAIIAVAVGCFTAATGPPMPIFVAALALMGIGFLVGLARILKGEWQ